MDVEKEKYAMNSIAGLVVRSWSSSLDWQVSVMLDTAYKYQVMVTNTKNGVTVVVPMDATDVRFTMSKKGDTEAARKITSTLQERLECVVPKDRVEVIAQRSETILRELESEKKKNQNLRDKIGFAYAMSNGCLENVSDIAAKLLDVEVPK